MQILEYTSNSSYFIGTRGERRCMGAVEFNNSPNIKQNVNSYTFCRACITLPIGI